MEEIDDLLHEGSEDVIAYFQNKAKILCAALQNFFQLLCPEKFLIITRSYNLSVFFCEEASKYFKAPQFFGEKPVEFIPDVYRPILAGIGATNLVFKNFFST
jgi:predicted NBD/HSP70 family sugar kinase